MALVQERTEFFVIVVQERTNSFCGYGSGKDKEFL